MKNLVEGIQDQRKRVESIKAACEQIGASAEFMKKLVVEPALEEADASIASGDVVRMLKAYKALESIQE